MTIRFLSRDENARVRPAPASGNRLKELLILLIILNCLWVFIIWPIDLMSGAFMFGLLTPLSERSIPVFQLAAELLMAVVTLTGTIGWLRSAAWGRSITLFGLGMFCFWAVNSLGWALLNNTVLALPMVVTLALSASALPALVGENGR